MPPAKPRPSRLAILSDLHLDTDVCARGTCLHCRAGLAVDTPGQSVSCPCGRAHLRAGDRAGFEAEGDMEDVQGRAPWGDMAREGRADAVLLLGDTCSGPVSMEWAAAEFAGLPVIAVAGNREFYGADRTARLPQLRTAADLAGVTFLEQDMAILNLGGRDIRFLGATLWTDFEVLQSRGMAFTEAMAITDARLHRVREQDASHCVSLAGRPFMAQDMRDLHLDTRAWLDEQLGQRFEGPTVIATHHAPLTSGAADKFGGSGATAGCYSDMSEMVRRHEPDLVAWGHTHAADVDMAFGRTRAVSHQRGYSWEADPLYGPKFVELG